jgi:hypothetical protein
MAWAWSEITGVLVRRVMGISVHRLGWKGGEGKEFIAKKPINIV